MAETKEKQEARRDARALLKIEGKTDQERKVMLKEARRIRAEKAKAAKAAKPPNPDAKKRGRPFEVGVKRSVGLFVKVTPEEREHWLTSAKAHGRILADVVREFLSSLYGTPKPKDDKL